MTKKISKERSSFLKKVYTANTQRTITVNSWNNVLCRIRKTTTADPNSEEFTHAVWFFASQQLLRQQLHPSQYTKLSLVQDKVDKLVIRYQHIEDSLTFIKALEKELCIDLPYSTRYRYIAFARKLQFTKREQNVIAYKVMLRKIGCVPEIKPANPDKCGYTHSKTS
jgi:hypothetical protein